MVFTFDVDGRYEYPVLTLANIDRTELAIITQIKDLTITPRFNAVSEMTFTIYKTFDAYNKITKNRLIHVEGFGWWIIYQTSETFDGGTPSKDVSCYSYEYTLNYKGVNLLNGTYKFYDIINQEETLLYKLFQIVPNWHVGHVDTELLSLYRTFDIPEATLYGFLMDDVSTTYQCIFQFDTENLEVNVYKANNLVSNTDIMLTFDNVLQQINIEELSTDIFTCLRVNGADNLSINIVNPLGDNKLYNFDYYKNPDWIEDPKIIQKLDKWNEEIEANREPYSDLLTEYKTQNYQLLKLQAQLTELKSELDALEIVRKNLAGQTDAESVAEFSKKTQEVNQKEQEIRQKEAEIEAQKESMQSVLDDMTEINNYLKFENYFTHEEQVFLSNFIIESVYTDTNFIVTDDMVIPEDLTNDTLVLTTTGTKKFGDLLPTDILIDEQYIANQLLEQGKEVIKTVSQPSFRFSVDSTNFLFSEKFLPFIKQIELGCIINIEIEEGNWAYPCLLEMVINYDNASLNLTFSNRFRQSSEEWTFAELHNEQVKTTTQVGSTLQIAAEPVLNGTINQVREYMNNNLIAANQQIQSTVDNEITIGNFGLRGRKKDDSYSSGYDPHQLWINNNLIVMTDDNWETTKLAIGFINDTYSVNAEVIAGTILAGENLIISNTGGTFTVDGKGATMTNGSISTQLRDSNGNIASEIVLNPEQGFIISNMKSSDSDKRVFYADTQGNLHFKGDLTGATGSFSGELKAATGTFSGNLVAAGGTFSGNLSAAGGTFSGNLSAAGGTFTGTLVGVDGTFSGTINAGQIKTGTLDCSNLYINGLNFSDLEGNLTYSQMSAIEIDADQITTGKLSADRIDVEDLYVGTLRSSYNSDSYVTVYQTGQISLVSSAEINMYGTVHNWYGISVDGSLNCNDVWGVSGHFTDWCYAPSWDNGSDKKLKTSIKKLDEKAILLIEKLNPVQYHYKVDDGCRFGFIAQEVQNALKVSGFTENKTVVTSHHMPDDAEGETTLGLRYTDLIAPIVVAVQQQQKEIYNLKNEIKKLKESIKL